MPPALHSSPTSPRNANRMVAHARSMPVVLAPSGGHPVGVMLSGTRTCCHPAPLTSFLVSTHLRAARFRAAAEALHA